MLLVRELAADGAVTRLRHSLTRDDQVGYSVYRGKRIYTNEDLFSRLHDLTRLCISCRLGWDELAKFPKWSQSTGTQPSKCVSNVSKLTKWP